MPKFENYQEAWAFAEQCASKYPSKGAYYASEEYKEFFPTLKALSETHNVGLATKAKEAMKEAVSSFDKYLEKGQIEIIPYNEWYTKDGAFNLQRGLTAWIKKLDEA